MFCSLRSLQFNCIFRLSQWQHRILRTGSPSRDFIPFIVALFHTRCREHERVFATKSPRIFGILQKSAGCLDSFIILSASKLAFCHSKNTWIIWWTQPRHRSGIYRITTLHRLLACICQRSVICFRRFLLNKNLKPLLRSKLSCCFEQSFFDAENHSSTSCKSFEAVRTCRIVVLTCCIEQSQKLPWPC